MSIRRLFPLTAHCLPLTVCAFLLTVPLSGQRHDALHYEISLTLSATDTLLRAVVATRWRMTGARPVVLDLDSALTVTAATVDARRCAGVGGATRSSFPSRAAGAGR